MLKLYDAKIQTFYAKVNLMKKAHTRIIKSMLAAMSLMLFAGCTDDAVSTDLLLTSAVELARTGKWQSCEDNAVTVLKRDPANVYAMLLRALAAEQLGKKDTALAMAKQAAENAPEEFSAQYTYGRLLAEQGNNAKSAITVLERALKLRPGNRSTLILLGNCSSKINADNAITYYLALPPEVQKMPEIQTRMAMYYLDRRDRNSKNLSLAFQALANAYKTANDNPVVVLNLAMFIDHYVKNKKKAYAFYNRYLILTKHNPELNPTRAQVQARMSALR